MVTEPSTKSRLDLRTLYTEHAELVRRAVIRLGGERADIDDLVQEVFLVAFRKHHEFEGRSKISTWLYGIAIRIVAGARRKTAVRRFLGLAQVDHIDELVERDTPARLFECREESALVYRILDRLAERKRTVLILHEIEELSGEEIAEAVGCPLATVWTRLHHARKDFLAQFERETSRSRAGERALSVEKKP